MNLEQILVAHLKADQGVAAITDRVSTRTPRTLDEPWVKIEVLDQIPERISRALHLEHGYVQFHCYAGSDQATGQTVANQLVGVVRLALRALPASPHDGAVVTGVELTGMRPLPDDELDPARERYIVTATIHLHPSPTGS